MVDGSAALWADQKAVEMGARLAAMLADHSADYSAAMWGAPQAAQKAAYLAGDLAASWDGAKVDWWVAPRAALTAVCWVARWAAGKVENWADS